MNEGNNNYYGNTPTQGNGYNVNTPAQGGGYGYAPTQGNGYNVNTPAQGGGYGYAPTQGQGNGYGYGYGGGYTPQPAPQPAPKNNKGGKIAIVIVAAVVAVVVIALLAVKVIVPNVKYKNAVDLAAEGSYDEAIAIFTDLGDFKDSAELKEETEKKKEEALLKEKIEEAKELFDSGDKVEAYKMLLPEKGKPGVDKVLSDFKEGLIEEVSEKIYWEEDEMSDYHWAQALVEDEDWDDDNPYFYLYLSQRKDNPEEMKIFMIFDFAHSGEDTLFTTPVHPTTIRFRGNGEEVDISVGYSDRDFDTRDGSWLEFINVAITYEQANTLARIFAGDNDVSVRASGSSSFKDYTMISSRNKGIDDMIEFINVMYMVYDVETETE